MDETHAALQWAHERVDITPPLGLPMGGYASRGTTGCRAIEDRLQCDMLLLAQGKTRFLAAALDLIAVDSLWTDDLRSRIARDLGMPRSHVVFAASHTHFGPESRLGNAAPWSAAHLAWLEQMTEAIAQGAARLAQKLAPCSLHVGSENVASQMYNRRLIRPDGTCCTVFRLPPPEENLSFGPVDPRLAVLRLDDANGRPAALATSVGIHPVVGGRDFYAISPDYPAVLRQTLESVYAAPALFFLSTAANVVPVRRGPRERSRIGRTLAGAAIMAAEGAERVEGSINVEWERLDVPRVPPHPLHGESLSLEITVLSFGDLAVLFLPGEIFVETGLYLQARSPFPRTHVVSMANQAVGYVPTRTAYAQGGYEPGHAARTHGMTEAAEEMITEAAVRLLLRSWEKTVRRG